jgi:hypothetical protein
MERQVRQPHLHHRRGRHLQTARKLQGLANEAAEKT